MSIRGSVVGTALAMALLSVACGGDAGSSTGPAARGSSAAPTPAASSVAESPEPEWGPPEPFPQSGTLPKRYTSIPEMSLHIGLSGQWRTSNFVPPFSFDAPRLAFPFTAQTDVVDTVFLTSSDPQAVLFARPNGVYARGSRVADLPADLPGWLQSNPFLRTSAAQAISMGGLSGVQIDAFVASIPEAQPGFCREEGIRCLPVATTSDGPVLYLKGEKIRFIVLHAGDAQLLMSIEASPSAFPIFAPAAERLLRSVRFQGV
ncbi:MAG: hypothetical protein ABR600_01780 [Actinomycetota bacterium]